MRRRYRFVLAVVMVAGLAAVWLTALAPPAAAIDGSDPRERFRVPGTDPGYGDPDDAGGGGLVYVDRSYGGWPRFMQVIISTRPTMLWIGPARSIRHSVPSVTGSPLGRSKQ